MEPALFTKMPGLPMDVLAYCCKVERRLLIKPSLSAPPETVLVNTSFTLSGSLSRALRRASSSRLMVVSRSS